MSDEPTLPRLPAVSWDERSQSFSNNPRKRGRHAHANNAPSSNFNSSDPAVFSSDDDPAIDNYVEGRRKKRYVGTWYSQHPASEDSALGESEETPRPKRTFARQLDSGVFLGSDDADSETMSEAPPPPSQPRLRQLDVRPQKQINEAERNARERIRTFVEAGTEDVVLYSSGLTELSNETIEPLKQLTRIPLVGRDVAFEQHPTQIRLNLAANLLTKLPGAMFDVSTITMLTLRGNQLEELPPAIGKLCNLQTLNVSQNRLKYLPSELLDLMLNSSSLIQVVLHPNPFLQPKVPKRLAEVASGPVVIEYTWPDGLPQDGAAEKSPPSFLAQKLARSEARFCDSRGQVLGKHPHPDGQGGFVTIAQSYKLEKYSMDGDNSKESSDVSTTSESGLTSVPSLLEATLRSCYATDHMPEMEALLREGPPQLQALLRRAQEQKEMGGLRCSRCKKTMVVPASEWVEWQALFGNVDCPPDVLGPSTYSFVPTRGGVKEEFAVPYLRRACSAKCGPEGVSRSIWGAGKGWEVKQELLYATEAEEDDDDDDEGSFDWP